MDPQSLPVSSTQEDPVGYHQLTEVAGPGSRPSLLSVRLAICMLPRLLGALQAMKRLEALGSKILGLPMRASALTKSLRSSGYSMTYDLLPLEPQKEASEA